MRAWETSLIAFNLFHILTLSTDNVRCRFNFCLIGNTSKYLNCFLKMNSKGAWAFHIFAHLNNEDNFLFVLFFMKMCTSLLIIFLHSIPNSKYLLHLSIFYYSRNGRLKCVTSMHLA